MFHNSCVLRSCPTNMSSSLPSSLNNSLPAVFDRASITASPILPCSSCICTSRPTLHYCSLPSYPPWARGTRNNLVPHEYQLNGYYSMPYGAVDDFFKGFRDAAALSFRSRRDRSRRPRTIFKPSQLKGLENAFQESHYIDRKERKRLAKALGLKDRQIKVWYQNRRAKNRRLVTDNNKEIPFDDEEQLEVDVEGNELREQGDKDSDQDSYYKGPSRPSSTPTLIPPLIRASTKNFSEREGQSPIYSSQSFAETNTWAHIPKTFSENANARRDENKPKAKNFISIQSILQ